MPLGPVGLGQIGRTETLRKSIKLESDRYKTKEKLFNAYAPVQLSNQVHSKGRTAEEQQEHEIELFTQELFSKQEKLDQELQGVSKSQRINIHKFGLANSHLLEIPGEDSCEVKGIYIDDLYVTDNAPGIMDADLTAESEGGRGTKGAHSAPRYMRKKLLERQRILDETEQIDREYADLLERRRQEEGKRRALVAELLEQLEEEYEEDIEHGQYELEEYGTVEKDKAEATCDEYQECDEQRQAVEPEHKQKKIAQHNVEEGMSSGEFTKELYGEVITRRREEATTGQTLVQEAELEWEKRWGGTDEYPAVEEQPPAPTGSAAAIVPSLVISGVDGTELRRTGAVHTSKIARRPPNMQRCHRQTSERYAVLLALYHAALEQKQLKARLEETERTTASEAEERYNATVCDYAQHLPRLRATIALADELTRLRASTAAAIEVEYDGRLAAYSARLQEAENALVMPNRYQAVDDLVALIGPEGRRLCGLLAAYPVVDQLSDVEDNRQRLMASFDAAEGAISGLGGLEKRDRLTKLLGVFRRMVRGSRTNSGMADIAQKFVEASAAVGVM